MCDNLLLKEIKALYDCCDSTLDAVQLSDIIFSKYKNPEHRRLITSYRDSIVYPDNIDLSSKISSLESVCFTENKDDALNLKNDLSIRSTDPIYLKTLERLVNKRRNNYNYNNNRNYNNYGEYNNFYKSSTKEIEYLSKKCPHCRINMKMPKDTSYVICGFADTFRGYDWRGCCNDWCFSCGKMLCKSWEKDRLNIVTNRFHDDECCKLHAKRNGYDYEKDYCLCSNKNVIRKETEYDYAF